MSTSSDSLLLEIRKSTAPSHSVREPSSIPDSGNGVRNFMNANHYQAALFNDHFQ
jgi:hypothetical protein